MARFLLVSHTDTKLTKMLEGLYICQNFHYFKNLFHLSLWVVIMCCFVNNLFKGTYTMKALLDPVGYLCSEADGQAESRVDIPF